MLQSSHIVWQKAPQRAVRETDVHALARHGLHYARTASPNSHAITGFKLYWDGFDFRLRGGMFLELMLQIFGIARMAA